ncbi:MAG: hypothetical protein V3V95_03395, partial [Thermodesulfobacteriota bacterium]
MFNKVLKKVFGSKNERDLKKMEPVVEAVNAFSDEMAALDSALLKERTAKFKERLAEGETLDEILPEAFALVREASVRTLN